MPQKIIQAILDLFRFHKLKLFVIVLGILMGAVLLFPYRDLGDLVTSKVAELSGNQIYVQFGDLGLNLFPQPGLEMSNVSLETPFLPAISAETLSVSPSISGLLSFKPGVSASATGLLGGRASLSTRGGSKTEQGTRKQIVSLSTSRTSLADLSKFAELPTQLKGQLSLDLGATIDPDFNEQPVGDLRVEIAKFQLLPSAVPTPFGPLNLPELALSHITLGGKLNEGRFTIEEGKLGSSKDELAGTVKGDVILRVERTRGQPMLSTGMYNFDIDFTVQASLAQKAALFLSFLDAYKSKGTTGTRYAFRISGTSFGLPPRITAIR